MEKEIATMKRLLSMTVLVALLAAGTFYAQERSATGVKDAPAKSGVPEIFCGHMKTGQLCSGNAQMFKFSATQKEQYAQALNSYNKAVGEAQKLFLEDAKNKVGLSETELALAASWFAEGLNPEINKILATKPKK
jgi:hypothetical protein